MGRYRFDLSVDYKGMDVEKYKIVKLGNGTSRVTDTYYRDGAAWIIVQGVYKYHDFYMEIETIWTLSSTQKTFKIRESSVEINMFGLDWKISIVPEDHIETLKIWHSAFTGVV